MKQPKLINNLDTRVVDELKTQLTAGSKISIAAASFSIYAFEALKTELSAIKELRFLFTSPAFAQSSAPKQQREFYIPKLHRERNLYGSDFEIRLRNQLSQRAIARECADWIRRKAHFKSNVSQGVLNGFLHLSDRAGEQSVFFPFNEFTTTELGCESGNNLCPGVCCMFSPAAEQYLQNFNELWRDSEKFQEVTETIIAHIESVYRENAPEYIYFVTLYHLFREFLEDLSEDDLPNEATGFKQSVIWNKLYNFQKDAALAIINKLEKYNGCILADSVGLGKTFTALAVIKYYENRNKSVLVLCPKKLNDNWQTYNSNYLTNPIAKDRLRYDVFFHSDLSRREGKTNGKELSHINWGNYDLVVIDESHNFRNGGKVTARGQEENQRENRYLQLMNRVIRSGVRTKVLMLSATPVNTRFNDLKNQLQLAYEGESERLDALLNTSTSIDDIFRQAQAAYNLWAKLPAEQRTTAALLNRLSFDFFEVLDSVTIARSRKHIEHYYDTTDIGQFPTRLAPLSRRPDLTDLSQAVCFKQIYALVSQLNLAIYTPSDFLLPSCVEKYSDQAGYTGLTRSGREKGIRQLMSINLLKRLESSVNSFRLTLQRIATLIEETLEQIDTLRPQETELLMEPQAIEESLDSDDSEVALTLGNKQTQIALQDLDHISWRNYLEEDLASLQQLLRLLADITPEHDSKLQQLKADLRQKFAHPINPGNRKVLIFTAFSDTAEYLYDHLAPWLQAHYGLHTALVTGSVEARSTLRLPKRELLDFNKVLTLFSPISKEKAALYPHIQEEIDVLIATDCISEGQNLQDCDYLINYDIHWNPVRIIQRFGRIDRIGSRNPVIQLVNYWPNVSLDEYIHLKGRVEARMKVSVMTGTGDDNPISPEEQGDLAYRREQLKRLQDEVVDLEEMNSGINIMDLGLNEFRLDLLAYLKEHPDVEHTPLGLHAVVSAREGQPAGALFVLKNRNHAVNIDQQNRLHPFYMVYISEEKEVIVNHLSPKELLDRMRLLCKGKRQPDAEACGAFNRLTQDGKQMQAYSELLGDAISSIIHVKEESDIDSFLSGMQGSLFTEEIQGLDDFELICFLVIK
ncbi:MAG: helicase-related protein [Parabacteroides sp.]